MGRDRSRFGSASNRRLIFATVFALGLAPVSSHALVTTLLSSETNVSGSLSDDTDSWSDSDQSFDLAPSIDVSQSFSTNTSSNSFAFSAHAVSVGRLRMSTRSTAGAGGETANGSAAHDFELRFSIDEAASYEFKNGNSTGSFPEATSTSSGTASLVYELRRDGASTPVFVYVAPTSGAAGIYRSGIIAAGTYVWTCAGSAVANGTAMGSQSAAAIGNVWLQLDPAPPVPAPGLQPFGVGVLLFALGIGGLLVVRRQRESV